jgi:isoquinoline 1-oxidoreductase subunit beta
MSTSDQETPPVVAQPLVQGAEPIADLKNLKQRRLKRRHFLVGGAATLGLLVGYALWPRSKPLNLAVRNDESLLTGWIKIGTDGRVVVIVPQAEMGQGVYTALPQIVADELGALWTSVAVEPAPLHNLYANKGMTADALEAVPQAFKEIAGWAFGQVIERFNVHITGGSTSVRGFHDSLRAAASVARALLCQAAAQRWSVDWQACEARDGRISHEGKSVSFAEVAKEAALLPPPASVPLRAVATRALVGQSVARLDIPAKCDGSAQYGMDIRLPNMVYACVRAAPLGAVTGVKIVYQPPAQTTSFLRVVEQPEFIATVAERYWVAAQALEKLDVRFISPSTQGLDDTQVAASLNQALAAKDAQVHQEKGAPAERLAQLTRSLQADYALPYLAHACLEPMTATARVNADGSVEIWAPTQSITLVVWAVARALGIEDEQVRVYPTLLGGGFGRKAESDACVQAALIARSVKRPVQLIWSRSEDFQQDKFRPAARIRLKGALDAQGRLAAWQMHIAAQSPTASFMARNIPKMQGSDSDASAVQGAVDLPYTIPDLQVAHAPVTIPVPVGFWRSVGHSINAFAVESFIDEMAALARVDPLAFRLAHLKDAPRYAQVLQALARFAGAPVPGLGRGYALAGSFGSVVAMAVDVGAQADGRVSVKRVAACVDCGFVIHPDTVRGQVEGGIIFALSAALYGQVNFAQGRNLAENFDGYPLLTLAQTPKIDVTLLKSDAPLGGVGEIGVPPLAPALANAIYAFSGKRLRQLPLGDVQIVAPLAPATPPVLQSTPQPSL